MASTISAGTTTTTALVYSADTSGVLQLQTNGGTTALTLDTSQNATFAGKVASASSLQLATNGTTTAVTIDPNQNVGVGVTPSSISSSYKSIELGAVGNEWSSTSGTNNFSTNAIRGTSWTYGSTNKAFLYQQDVTGGHLWFYAPSGTAGNAISWTQAMTLDTSGNLLLGTTSFAYTAKGAIWNSNGSINIGSAGTGGSTLMNFGNGNGAIGSITVSGSTTTYVTSSDYRLKENIAPMTGALAIVAQLKPVTYDWISDKSKGQGFIAHELQAVVPDCVTGEKDAVDANGNPVYQGIDTSFLVATLTAAIKELSAQVTTLQTQVTALKG